MAATRQSDASLIKPLQVGTASLVRRGTLGATVEAGEIVALQSDGKWDPADAAAAPDSIAMAIQGGDDGDRVDLLRHGACECMTGATPGQQVFLTNTAGEIGDTQGTALVSVGYAESDTVLFFQPRYA